MSLFSGMWNTSSSTPYRRDASIPLSRQEELEDDDPRPSGLDSARRSHVEEVLDSTPHDSSLCAGQEIGGLRHRRMPTLQRHPSWEVCHDTGWFTGLPPPLHWHLPHGVHVHVPHGLSDAIHHIHIGHGEAFHHTPAAIAHAKQGLRCVLFPLVCMPDSGMLCLSVQRPLSLICDLVVRNVLLRVDWCVTFLSCLVSV
jgi:hypothetical protein